METYLGTILAFGFNWAPVGWLSCNGQLVSVPNNTALFSLLGTIFGGDGRNTFGLPDLQGRVIMGQGKGAKLSGNYIFGQQGGYETATIDVTQIPAHNHPATFDGASATVKVSSQAGSSNAPGARNAVLAAAATEKIYNNLAPDFALNIGGGAVTGNISTGNTGAGLGHPNLQPFTVLNYCIATEGLYPSRP